MDNTMLRIKYICKEIYSLTYYMCGACTILRNEPGEVLTDLNLYLRPSRTSLVIFAFLSQ